MDSASANDTAVLFPRRLLLFTSRFKAPTPLPAPFDDARVLGFLELVYTLSKSRLVGRHLNQNTIY